MVWFLLLISTFVIAEKKPADLKRGQELFQTHCFICHGSKGEGDGPTAASLNPKPRSLAKDSFKNGDSPAAILKTLTEGLKGTMMPSFAYLPEKDREALVQFVLSLRKKG